MKNMLATLCSNPLATKAMMGKNIPKILPTTALAGQSQPYRHTYQPVTEDPPEECGAPGQLQFAFGYIQGFSSYRPR